MRDRILLCLAHMSGKQKALYDLPEKVWKGSDIWRGMYVVCNFKVQL